MSGINFFVLSLSLYFLSVAFIVNFITMVVIQIIINWLQTTRPLITLDVCNKALLILIKCDYHWLQNSSPRAWSLFGPKSLI